MSRQTTPLAKAWTTLEGQLVAGLSIVAIVLSAIDPTKLPAKWAGVFVTVSTIVLTLQRGLIKRAALQQVNTRSLELWPEAVNVHPPAPPPSPEDQWNPPPPFSSAQTPP